MKKLIFVIILAVLASVQTASAKGTICKAPKTCESMGYNLTKTQVKRVPSSAHCSACPLDGTKWACTKDPR